MLVGGREVTRFWGEFGGGGISACENEGGVPDRPPRHPARPKHAGRERAVASRAESAGDRAGRGGQRGEQLMRRLARRGTAESSQAGEQAGPWRAALGDRAAGGKS